MSSSDSILESKEQLFRKPFYAKDGKTRLPQYVAHRGFNKIYPENTRGAFTAAVDVGCHGIETDVQVSKDGVVVISHDPTLNRCFGIDKSIKDCDWEYLSTLWTRREPRGRMLRLSDVLDFLNEPSNTHVWVLLDIKRNNNVNVVIKKIAELIKTTPSSSQPWSSRIVLGCWAANYFPTCKELLPDFQVALIGYNVITARHVLHTNPSISFNTHYLSLKGPLGYRFVDSVHNRKNDEAVDRPPLAFTWTVNTARDMRWAIRSDFDVILTDDPALYRQISSSWDDAYADDHKVGDNATISERLSLTWRALWVSLLSWLFPIIYPHLHRFITRIKGSTSRT